MRTDPFRAAVACMELWQSLRCEVYTDERGLKSLAVNFSPASGFKINQIYRWFFTGIAKNTSLISITLCQFFRLTPELEAIFISQ